MVSNRDEVVADRDDPTRPRGRRVLVAVTIAYTVFIGLVTLTPQQLDRGPGGLIGLLLDVLAAHRVTSWLTVDRVEKLANVGMFVPFGLLVALTAGRRRWWVGLLAGAAYSCLIEGTQATVLAATRVADVSDLITNTIGSGLGAGLGLAVAAHRARRPVLQGAAGEDAAG